MTGASGFAGGHLVEWLLQSSPAVAAWGLATGMPMPTTDPRVEWSRVDVVDAAAVASALAGVRPSVIYHCAGVPHVGQSWADPLRALHVNALGTHHLIEGLRAAGHACPVLIVGSALVYKPTSSPLTESHPIGPSTPYGVSKLAQEMVGARARDLPVFLARPLNHAGPRQSPDFVTSSFAKQIAEIEAGLSEPVLRVGNLEARRDITDVRDTVRAYALIVERGRPHRPYNVCSGRAHRIGDLLDILIGLSRADVRLERDPARMRPSDDPVVIGDRSRIGAETGWAPGIPIERTLGDLLEFWRDATKQAPASRR